MLKVTKNTKSLSSSAQLPNGWPKQNNRIITKKNAYSNILKILQPKKRKIFR